MRSDSLRQRLRGADYLGVAAEVPETEPCGALARLVTREGTDVGQLAERQLAAARAVGDRSSICDWLEVLSHARRFGGRPAGAFACAQELMRRVERDSSWEAVARLLLARSLAQNGDHSAFFTHARRAHEIAVAVGDRWLEGQASLALGGGLAHRGSEAMPWIERATEALGEHPFWTARCEIPVPMAVNEAPDAAQARFARVATVMADHGDRSNQAICLVGRSRQLRMLGRLEEALACSQQAMEVGHPQQRALATFGVARVCALRGELEQADALYRSLARDGSLPPGIHQMIWVPSLGEAARRGDVAAFARRLPRLAPFAGALWADLWQALAECEAAGLPSAEQLALAAMAYDGSPPEVRRERAPGLLRLAGGRLPCGPLLLDGTVGEGGMATVWRATDARRPGEAFAVKLLRVPEGADGSAMAESFRRELRALAALEHPHVQAVVDQQQTGAALEMLSGGRIEEGSPALVMPLAAGGTLRPWCGRLAWPEVRSVLEQVLSGLAAAHARGVLHLDLKPENVLLAEAAAPFHARLADFGVARAIGERRADRLVGTPAYMAPEQFRGDERAMGPGTDLYALGCLAWALVTGRSPFRGTPAQLRSQHLSAPLPPLVPAIDVPAGLEAWLGRLLARAVHERFPDAPAAARSLRGLGAAVPRGDASVPGVASDSPDTFAFDLDDPTGEVPMQGLLSLPDEPAEVPRRWVPPPPPTAYAGRLVGLRVVPLVGRTEEQELLWGALREAAGGATRGVALLAEQGMGAGSLVHWLRHQVRLLGLGTVLTARMAAAPTRGLGLHGLVQDALRTRGLQGEALAAWLHRCPWRPTSASVAQCVAALEADEVPERLLPLLAGFASDGLVVLVCEGVHRGPPVDELIGRLMASGWRLLVVLTADVTIRDGRTGQWEAAGVRVHALPRLAPGAARELADSILPLHEVQREQLLAACGGHPGRLVRTLKRMVEQGLTTPDSDRFLVPELSVLDLEPGLDLTLPRLSQAASRVVFAVAVLGGDVPKAEVVALLDERGQGWVPCEEVSVSDGIARVPAWLQAAAIRHLDELGELASWHGSAARSLRGEGGWVALRRGRHHVLAGEPDEGAVALRIACDRLEDLAAATVFPEWEAALEAAGVPRGAPRWLGGWTAWLLGRVHGGYGGADDELRQRASLVLRLGDPTQRAVARLALATIDHGADLTPSRTLYREVSADDAVALPVRALASLSLAYLDLHEGRLDDALAGAVAATEGLPVDHPLHPASMQIVGKIYQQQGQLDEAERWTRACLAHGGQTAGNRRTEIFAWAVLGDVLREGGDLDEAERCYREGLALSRAYIDDHRFVDELNLVLLDARRRRLGDHAERLPTLQRHLQRMGGPFVVFLQLVALGLPSRRGQAEAVVGDIVQALAPTGWCDAELATTAEVVAELLAEQGRGGEAQAVLGLAHAQWQALGRPDQAERVRASAARGGAEPAW